MKQALLSLIEIWSNAADASIELALKTEALKKDPTKHYQFAFNLRQCIRELYRVIEENDNKTQ